MGSYSNACSLSWYVLITFLYFLLIFLNILVLVLLVFFFLIILRGGFSGAYDDEEAAAHAYDLAALKYWGPETILNFPVI